VLANGPIVPHHHPHPNQARLIQKYIINTTPKISNVSGKFISLFRLNAFTFTLYSMTSRTHDLAAFTSLTLVIHYLPELPQLSLATVAAIIGANFLGGLFPDLDEPTAQFWQRFRAGSIVGRLIAPLLGGHRLISHSLVGLGLTGWLLSHFLTYLGTIILVDMYYVWWAFMIGMVSHLVMDALTKEGIPLLFPIPVKVGFPPLRFLRITTGKLLEKAFIFPGLMLLTTYLIYLNRLKLLTFLTHLSQ
jgi:inner membrane protein